LTDNRGGSKNTAFYLQYNSPTKELKSMTSRIPLALSVIVLFASIAFSQEATPSPSPAPKPAMTRAQSQRIIISTEKKLWEGWKTKDLKVFRSNLAADSLMVGENGVATKADSLKEMESVSCDVKSYALSDIKVTFLNNDAALMTYKGTQDATCGGQQVPAAVWASSIYVKRGGRWLAMSHQETPAK
jgi:Domain of unknown function (DUF4440)